jgi:hypothetical protein
MPMGMMHSQVVLVALWAAAALTSVWVLGPMLLFLSPLRRHDSDAFDDPREVEPSGKDPDFDRSSAELKALGFVPVGKTVERFRFFTPLHWRWVSNGTRWFASPDRKVYVAINRLSPGHPQRMSADTTFEGGGLLTTSTTPTGMGGEIGERHRRVEVGSESAGELVREHERQVKDFSRDADLRVKPATLADMAAETLVMSRPFVARGRVAPLYFIAMIYLVPFWSVIYALGRSHHVSWVPAASLCVAAGLFALVRLVALPEYRGFRWLGFVGLVAFGFLFPVLMILSLHRP